MQGCSCSGVKVDDWLRAERLAHDVIFDLNNYAQGEKGKKMRKWKDGGKEGWKEGRKKGKKEERKEGRKRGRKEGIMESRKE